jgi:uncharacterized protein (DUF305 family)
MRDRRLAGVATSVLVIVLAVLGAGCGTATDGGDGPGATEGTKGSATVDHNAADVAFASEMLLHHQQALQMVSMAGYQASTPTVKKLAAGVETAQEPETKQMTAWLTTWGEKVPGQSHDHEEVMPGWLTQEDLHEVGSADGVMFDRLWITMMMGHHQGAVTMAMAQQKAGQSPAVAALAKKIQVRHTQEIATMRVLLRQLPTS